MAKRKGKCRPPDDYRSQPRSPRFSWLWKPLAAFLAGVVMTIVAIVKALRWLGSLGESAPPEPPQAREPAIAPVASSVHALVPLEATEQPEVHHPDGRIEHPWVRREHRDVQVWKILAFMGFIIVFASMHFYLFRRLFGDFEGTPPTHDAAAYRGVGDSPLPRAPRLEQLSRLVDDTRPNVFLRQQSAEASLDRYGPTADDGYIRVPIERAMQQLPARIKSRDEQPTADKSRGLVDAGESNSGRMFERSTP